MCCKYIYTYILPFPISQAIYYLYRITMLFFKPQAFRDFLKMKRFTKMSDSHQYKIFQEFGGNTAKLRVNNKPEHCWKVASSIADAEYKLKDNDFKEEDPY